MADFDKLTRELGALRDQLALVQKMNADNAKMRAEYMKERDIARRDLDAALLQVRELQKERDGLTVVSELMWQSKTLLEAHQHFVSWRDKTGDFAQKQDAGSYKMHSLMCPALSQAGAPCACEHIVVEKRKCEKCGGDLATWGNGSSCCQKCFGAQPL